MDEKMQRLITREINNMEFMHHPNIIRLFEVKIIIIIKDDPYHHKKI